MANFSRIFLLSFSVSCICCGQVNAPYKNVSALSGIINEKGATIGTRFNAPAGFSRIAVEANSFAEYLRNLPLKPAGSKVHYYNGEVKQEDVYDAVIDLDIGNKDLEQCADAIMRLRGEYFYARKLYDSIAFNFTNGFKAEYNKWINGYRILVSGNNVSWRKSAEPSNTYKDFRAFMDIAFIYCGTLSLSKSMKHKEIKDLTIGDVFVHGGTPGHAEIILDVAQSSKGEKVFMLAQSYMPAQEIQVLKNLDNSAISPWYHANVKDQLETPQWTFGKDELKGW